MKSTLYVAVIAVLLAFVACQSPQPQTTVPASATLHPPQANRLRTEAISSDAVQLDWPEEMNTSFQIERQSARFGIESVAVVEGSSYTDTGLMVCCTYTYRLTQIGAGAAITLESAPVTVLESEAGQGKLIAKAVSSVTLKPSKPATVLTWQRTTFTATTVGDSANRVRWEQTGGSLAISNNKAVFSSSKEGTFTITAISLATSSKRASASIKVQKGILYGISLKATPNPVTLGNASTLEVGFDGRGSFGTGINFQVSPNTGSINSVGNNRYEFRATDPGAYTIKATSSFNPIKTASIIVNVDDADGPTLSSLQLTANPTTVDLNQASGLSLTFTGTGAFGRGVTWTVSPTGTVTGAGPYSFASGTAGTYTIKATSTFDASKSSSATVTVRTPVIGSSSLGKWSEVIPLPAPPVHLAVLPTGKVIFWEYDENNAATYRTKTFLWDAVNNGSVMQINNAVAKLFCSGHSLLADGRLFAIGGTLGTSSTGYLMGTRSTSFFDANTLEWTRGPNMNFPRFYPSATVLGNGDVLSIAGTDDQPNKPERVTVAEVWQSGSSLAATDSLRFKKLSNAPFSQSYYPMTVLAANGKIFNLGPQKTMGWLDTNGSGSWQSVGQRFDPSNGERTYGNAVMYDAGKVVLIGGNDPPTATTLTLDLNVTIPGTTQVGSMAFARRQHNATVLPDGTVLVTGGTGSAGFNNPAQSVLAAELWNPSSGTFKTLSSAQKPRLYHSVAALLPDGRVISAGGSGSGAPVFKNAEIFSPPYLFNNDGTPATRPSITGAPGSIGFGSGFSVTTGNEDVSRFSLIRLSSVTHSTNFDQRFINMPFNRSGTQSSLTAPANGNLAPPGYYLLFALNAKGVPSVGKILKLN